MLWWLIIFILLLISLKEAIKISPYPVVPFITNITWNKIIFLNPFTWNREILNHEISHVVRGHSKNHHDEKFWEIYNKINNNH